MMNRTIKYDNKSESPKAMDFYLLNFIQIIYIQDKRLTGIWV